MVDSFIMYSLLVFPLILAILSAVQTDTKVNDASCHRKCPAGFYKVGDCNDPVAKNRCKMCGNNTFTEIENTITKCQRCKPCGHYEVETMPCAINRNVVCDCMNGYYDANHGDTHRDCRPCPCGSCQYHPRRKRCPECNSCLNNPQCKSKCKGPVLPPPTNQSTIPSATSSSYPSTTSSKSISKPDWDKLPWMGLVGALLLLLVLFWLLLFSSENPICYLDRCPCWNANKELEDPKSSEQLTREDSSPTTMILKTSEESPVLNLSPVKPEHPANISPLLPGAEDARQDEQSDHWPAIVLYAIIKEVPLRRWKEFLRLLSVADQQLERVELEAGLGLGSMERQYQMLRLWSQRSSAKLSDVFSALHYMDLSGCAQLLQENLEKLQWDPELKQGFTYRSSTEVMLET